MAEKTLKHFVAQVVSGSLIRPSPVMVLHVLDEWEGGLTEIELRALRELALGAGARAVHIWGGRELTDQELKDWRFPGDHWLGDTRPPPR